MREWNAKECNWTILEYQGYCSKCGEKATNLIMLNKLLKIQTKERRLCTPCSRKFINGEINL